jgi:hypothetical protein
MHVLMFWSVASIAAAIDWLALLYNSEPRTKREANEIRTNSYLVKFVVPF